MILALVLSRSSSDRISQIELQALSTSISPLIVEQLNVCSNGLEARTPVHESDDYDTLIISGCHQAFEDHVFHFGGGFCTLDCFSRHIN